MKQIKGQNASQNASQRASNLTEIRFRAGGFAPPWSPLPGLYPGPTGGPCLLCFHIVIGLATPLYVWHHEQPMFLWSLRYKDGKTVYTRVIQKLMQFRQYHDKKEFLHKLIDFASSNYSSCICTSNLNKSVLAFINYSLSFIIWMHYVGYYIKSFVAVSAVGFPDILNYIMNPVSNKYIQ